MSVAQSPASPPVQNTAEPGQLRPWLLPAWLIVGAYWIYSVVLQAMGLPIAYTFFGLVIGGLALPLLFIGRALKMFIFSGT